jgi:hypothetical protein
MGPGHTLRVTRRPSLYGRFVGSAKRPDRPQQSGALEKNHLRDGHHITSARSYVLLASEPLTGAETTRRLAHSINRSQATNRRNYPMKTIDNAQELKTETLQVADTYRAPRLVALGSAVGLVQAGILGEALDAGSNPYANRVQIPRR